MKFTKEQKEIILDGLEQLLIQFTTKCNGSYKYGGLCMAISDLLIFHPHPHQNEIGNLLLRYINSNAPMFKHIRIMHYSGYWWQPYNYTPRIKYLRKHINKLKKELNSI